MKLDRRKNPIAAQDRPYVSARSEDEGHFYVRLGAALTLCRREACLSQDTVAHWMGRQRTSVANWESGVQKVTAWQLVMLLDLYGVMPADFFAWMEAFDGE